MKNAEVSRAGRGYGGTPVAFTLIELLVVVAIVGILAALLLPALSRAKSSAKRIKCVSNLHQLALAAHLYFDDNNGNCFRYRDTNDLQLYWFGWMGSGAEGTRVFDASKGVLHPYLKGRGVEACPAFDAIVAQVKLKAAGTSFAYGFNLSLSAPWREGPVNVARLNAPAGLALFGDAAQVNTWQAPASRNNPMLEEWYYIDTSSNQPNGHFRHERRGNVAFMDGHIGLEQSVPGSFDARLPGHCVGRYREEILTLR